MFSWSVGSALVISVGCSPVSPVAEDVSTSVSSRSDDAAPPPVTTTPQTYTAVPYNFLANPTQASTPTVSNSTSTTTNTTTNTTTTVTTTPTVVVPTTTSMRFTPGLSFNYQINGTPRNTGEQVLFVDLFDTSASKIAELKNKGKKVVCYFSAGSAENWRPDYRSYPSSALGQDLDDWAGERWVDIRNATVVNILKNRVLLAASKGCHAIDPDNVDGYENHSGFSLNTGHTISLLKQLAATAKSNGLSIGLKNAVSVASALASTLDFVVVEECFAYGECNGYSSFANAGKSIFSIEYETYNSSWCWQAKQKNISLIFADDDLTGNVRHCP